MGVLKPKRGEVWWINFAPSVGSEIRKTRPAIVVSNSLANKHLSRFQVVPVTSKTERVYPSECLVTIGKQQCKAVTDQITTVAGERLLKKAKTLSANDLHLVETVLKIQLGLH